VLANAVTQFLLEHPQHPGQLNSFDAASLEILVLINNPNVQATASRNWAYLSPHRRLCLDLVVQLETMAKEKLPPPTLSARHPLLQQFDSAAKNLEKVLFYVYLLMEL
jgi:hypothetical protein